MPTVALAFFALTVIGGQATPMKNPPLKVEKLTCEFQSLPLAIDHDHPRLGWKLNSVGTYRRGQSAFRVKVAESLAALNTSQSLVWDSGIVKSSEPSAEYAGPQLKDNTVYFWTVQVWDESGHLSTAPEIGRFETGLRTWKATWINDGKAGPKTEKEFYEDDPVPRFRREFQVKKDIARAKLFISGLGYYEAFLNGIKVGDHELDPGWTAYDKTVLYAGYDVTKLVHPGPNCMGVILGNGWYNPQPIRLFGNINMRATLAIGRPRFISELHIEYTDHTKEVVLSDGTWKSSPGAIRRNSQYLGEWFDTSSVFPQWVIPGGEGAGDFVPVGLASEKIGTLKSQNQPPIRAKDRWHAVALIEPKPGVFVYDMGENFAGWVSLKLDGEAPSGAKIVLRYGELLNPDSTLNPMTSVAGQIKGNRRGTDVSIGGEGAPTIAWQSDTFVVPFGPTELHPKFGFRGFRYVEVTGLQKALPLSVVSAIRLQSDVESVGKFECSDPVLNKLQEVCLRTFHSNMFSVQSDCPHREKMGYGGDIVATSDAFLLNFDMSQFYRKVVRDFAETARPNGVFTDTAPYTGLSYCGIGWAMAHPVLIDQLHQYYGDTPLEREQYQAARKWLLEMDRQYPSGIVTDGLSDHESLVPTPAKELVSILFFHSANLLAKIAERQNRPDDAGIFRGVAEKIRVAYLREYSDLKTGKIGTGSQANQAFAIWTGLVEGDMKAKALKFLIDDIHAHKDHLTTGIMGTKFMLDVLSREGQVDLAYEIVTQPEFPSYAWMLKNGATTLWEHWQFSDNTFSHNHPMFGSVSEWMIKWLGGIQVAPNAKGADRFIIHPSVPKALGHASASYDSIRGRVESRWQKQGGKVTYTIRIPASTEARIILPTGARIVKGKEGLRENIGTIFSVGSGDYVFEATLP